MVDTSLVERVAARYPGRWEQGWAQGKLKGDPVYSAVLDRLPAQGRLLDVGCGEGYLLALVSEALPDVVGVGVDHDERRLDVARTALGEGVDLQARDARDLGAGGFDAITCLDVLHYLPPADQDVLIAGLALLLAPGGQLMIRDAESGGGLRSWVTTASERLMVAIGRHKGEGVFFRSRDATVGAMQAAGLTVDVAPCQQGTPFANVLFVGTSG